MSDATVDVDALIERLREVARGRGFVGTLEDHAADALAAMKAALEKIRDGAWPVAQAAEMREIARAALATSPPETEHE